MKRFTRLVGLALTCTLLTPLPATASELMVYSSRNASYIKPLLDDYSRETGVAVSYLVAPANALISRLEIEGNKSKADLLLTTGVANFIRAKDKGLLASVQSDTLMDNVPAHLRDPDLQWFALSKRARALVYNSAKVSPQQLSTYADLASPHWQGKLCLRNANAEYSQSLIAALIHHSGKDASEQILRGWTRNLAQPTLQDDGQIMTAIAQGLCDVGIANSYYYARVLRDEPDTRLKLFWPDQKGSGVHMNISGAAVTAHAPNRAQAIDLLEWLSTKKVQRQYASLSMEYPANPSVYPAREVAKWGRFKEDNTPLSALGTHYDSAKQLVQATAQQQ